jgi:hypothetical protein
VPDIYEQVVEEIREDLGRWGGGGRRLIDTAAVRRSHPAARYCTDCGGPTVGERCEGCESDYERHMKRARSYDQRAQRYREGD